jgi:hypothetical protein
MRLRRRARRMHPYCYVNSDGTIRLDIDHDTNEYLDPRRCGWCASEDIHCPIPPDNAPWKEICRRCGAWHYWFHGDVNDGWHVPGSQAHNPASRTDADLMEDLTNGSM